MFGEGCYAETLVKRKMTVKAILGMTGMILLAVLGIVLTFASRYGIILLVAAALLIFIFYKYLRVEYEYIFVTGELQADRIYSGAVRKSGPRIDVSNTECVEKITAEELKTLRGRPKSEVTDYTSHYADDQVYAVRYHDNQGNKVLLFEPDEKLLKTMWKTAPSRVRLPKE